MSQLKLDCYGEAIAPVKLITRSITSTISLVPTLQQLGASITAVLRRINHSDTIEATAMTIKIEPARLAELAYYGVELPPTEDELPYDDGIPMESPRHAAQMRLLIDPLQVAWADREDFFVGGNMFVYFSLEQVRNRDFRGPDFFVVLNVPKRERKSWVVWEEGKGPDVVIELLSQSTVAADKAEKKLIYQDRLRVPEYFWFDPFGEELAGFSLREGGYELLELDNQGRLLSQQLGLCLVRWEGTYQEITTCWLRWATLEGALLLTAQEVAEQEQQRADEQQQRADEQQQRADEQQQRADREQQRAERLAEQLRSLGIDPNALE